ncbi:hypothetical protein D3C72_1863500 [compost metagenome]
MAAEDAALEAVEQADLGQLQLDLVAVGPRSAGDAALEPRMDLADGGGRMGNGDEVAVQRLVAAGAEAAQPVVGDLEAGLGLDERRFVLHGLAGEDVHRFLGRELPAELAEHVGKHAVGDGFGIDEHAVAIEENGGKGERGHCEAGVQRSGPMVATPPFRTGRLRLSGHLRTLAGSGCRSRRRRP